MNDASDQGRAAAAAEIKKALRAPTGQLCKSNPPVALGQFRKSMRAVRRLRGMSLAKSADMLERAARVAAAAEAIKAAPIDASVDAVRKVHATGPQLETGDTMWLYKTSLPAQSSNSRNSNDLADTGAGSVARQPAPGARTTQFGPPHSASLSDGRPPSEDPTLAALKAIFAKPPQRGL